MDIDAKEVAALVASLQQTLAKLNAVLDRLAGIEISIQLPPGPPRTS